MTHAEHKKHESKGIGPGGLHCPCCTDFPPAKQRRIMHRKSRRIAKQSLRREAFEVS